MAANPNYNVTFTVDATPEQAFAAIGNPRAWWSQEIEGDTDRLGAEWNYHYRDIHRARFKVTEYVPNQKVVWHVTDNSFNFIKDQSEWVGNDLVFTLTPKGDKTEIHFTHAGLVPAYECYDICSNAWSTYVAHSLHDLIATGEGQPNPIEAVVEQAREMSQRNYAANFPVRQSPEDVFAAINNVRAWWIDEFDGESNDLGAEFTVHFGDIHHSTQKVTEFVPNEKVVWHVVNSNLTFIADRSEWTGTDIVFEIARQGEMTELRFTHVGLIPAIECYNACSDAWSTYIKHSLFDLITTGNGEPTHKAQFLG